MFSSIALKIYSLIKNGTILTNARFWKKFSRLEDLEKIKVDSKLDGNYLNDNKISLVCTFDNNFPNIDNQIKNSEKPFLFAYKGDINLLTSTKNVAVIGSINPTEDIIKREQNIVSILTKDGNNIVSGLAKGCDTVAHKTCLQEKGKTIAILPTTFENIYPKENEKYLNKIIASGGLVITEYVTEPKNKYESINRFVARDRLQAMYSSSIVLIASHRKGEGDSGSRHAMQKAKEYGKDRYVIYDENIDKNNPIFGLNKDLVGDGVIILTNKNIKNINNFTVLVDLDDTLIFSTELNNDAYNYALEKFGFERIKTSQRITRDILNNIPEEMLTKITNLKQEYFTKEWIKYRLVLNVRLLNIIKAYGKENCFIWTKSQKSRAEAIMKEYNLQDYFTGIIFDNKSDISNSIKIIKENTNKKQIIIYENNLEYLRNYTKSNRAITNNNCNVYELFLNIE